MPRLSVWSIRLSLIYLVCGWVIGALLMINRGVGFSAGLWQLVDLHVALVLFGWTFQLVVGVAYRMLPKFGTDRGRPLAAWASVVAINFGVLWVVLGLFVGWASPVVAAISWLVATVCFGWHAWPRIKAFGR